MATKTPTDGAAKAPAPVVEVAQSPAAPAQPQWIMPRHKQIERQGAQGVPYVHKHPQVRGGVCEFCGVIDGRYPSEYQYKMCPHYRGMQLRCSYCPDSKNPDDVINHAVLNIYDHPTNPNSMVVVCDSYECSRAHESRFRTSRD